MEGTHLCHLGGRFLTVEAIIAQRSVRIVFQPIVSLEDGSVFAQEALTRGPEGPLFTPAALFRAAQEANLLFAMELLCREEALLTKPAGPVTLNVDPFTLNDPTFTRGMTAQALDNLGISPSDVIFELTERIAVQDYGLLRQTVDHYRSQGYRIALDDVGSGYSNLRLVAELQPEILKIDMGLVQGLSTSRARRAAVHALAVASEDCGALAVAEGIERPDDLSAVQDLGIPLGQGFLLGRPAPSKPMVPASMT